MNDHIKIEIHQHTPSCLVYYTIQVGNWVYDGDALDVPSALKMINHNLKWDLERYEDEMENEE